MEYPFDLGGYCRKIRTDFSEAQTWFDRGLIWTYAFHHEEAARCFELAWTADSSCAMAAWGLAYTLGPNYNKPWSVWDEEELRMTTRRVYEVALAAEQLAGREESLEQALCAALRLRYPQAEPPEPREKCEDWNKAYAIAMRAVYDRFGDDLDVAVLFADALMNLTPWQLWDLQTGEAGMYTMEIKRVMERAFTESPQGSLRHPGLLHLYIHLMEMSSTPEAALGRADVLRDLVPDAGHLQHMPSHLDVLCGRYEAAIVSNQAAIRADEKFIEWSKHTATATATATTSSSFYTLYRCHDYHFCIYAALFAGKKQVALDTVARLEESLPEALLRVSSPPMADWLEVFCGMRVHVLVRFGEWEELLAYPVPSDTTLYSVTTALIHYGKGVAHAARGETDCAARSLHSFLVAREKVSPSRTLFNNSCLDILGIAEAMLRGELAYRLGEIEQGFEWLRTAISRADSLPYDEPWGWMQPARHAYGALLLEQGRVEQAMAVYAADLGIDGGDTSLPRALRHPRNVWAVHGYRECLRLLGREDVEIDHLLGGLLDAADVTVSSSCFCRK
ncbi:hypothetical protein ASPZODRAFT_19884 [Penicilliopsis zonata CBS 506.65]|uniref:TPR domain protein n=1 Tax=Penicilliopsis zonata CBS 506.65 TaxID=1073090 RepID=A0A1L9S6W9_9EURO|nr:hypothetical protein ASPZODRAFT_19884 [Penicilliopsis zonata CBS 506.65]OJJ42904.1 hypothetical protein ASPZODRAFT_19884 [Penicilliopsis zonata CBS 506.65]